MEITNLNQLNLNKAYTFQDYLSWKFVENVELLKGYISKMSPSPSSGHQNIASQIYKEIAWYLKGNTCKSFFAPFDVYLPHIKGDGQTVVQPDICVVCDVTKIEKKGCIGSPDLVIEILSPGNVKKEIKDKYEIYQEAKVKEYWLVYPAEQVLQVYLLEKNKYVGLRPLTTGDTYKSKVLKDFEIAVETIFEGSEGLI